MERKRETRRPRKLTEQGDGDLREHVAQVPLRDHRKREPREQRKREMAEREAKKAQQAAAQAPRAPAPPESEQ